MQCRAARRRLPGRGLGAVAWGCTAPYVPPAKQRWPRARAVRTLASAGLLSGRSAPWLSRTLGFTSKSQAVEAGCDGVERSSPVLGAVSAFLGLFLPLTNL